MISVSRILLSGSIIQSNLQELTGENRILLFQKATYRQQVEACYWILNIFADDWQKQNITTLIDVYRALSDHFSCGDSLYLYIGWDGHVWGTVGLDYKQQEPFISELAVIPQMRGLGIATKLLRFAEQEAKQSDFGYVKLWCEDNMVPFYVSHGYGNEEKIEIPAKIKLTTMGSSDIKTTMMLKETELDYHLDRLSKDDTILGIEKIPSYELYTLTKTLKKV